MSKGRKKKKPEEILVVNYTTRRCKIITLDEDIIIFNDKLDMSALIHAFINSSTPFRNTSSLDKLSFRSL